MAKPATNIYSHFRTHTADLGITFVRPDRKNEKHRFGDPGGIRQLIESVLTPPKANSPWNDTAPEPPTASAPASANDSSP
ncbi:hypothetical protein GCM10009765_33060 [Fodinicola feengrottensis]|uniref:Uncharacterized protein n=1 Tax=Fodinicola feengrottensis TaxID=435914 RepID=A0ABN2H3F9_9ACTN